MFKKIISFFLLIIFITWSLIDTIYAIWEDQILTAPSPTFVENQIQPVSSFKMNRYLLWYNTDSWTKSYVKQNIIMDRDSIGWFSFRMSRISELKPEETAEKIRVSLLQKNNAGVEQVLKTELLDWISSVSKTEIKWIFPNGITIVPFREATLKIEVENPKTTDRTFSYYIHWKDEFDTKPMYFWTMVYFDWTNETITWDILNLNILRSDWNNLWVPIPSDYKYPELDSIASQLPNASDIKVKIDTWLTPSNQMCNTFVDGWMKYRWMTSGEFEYIMRHSSYFNELIDKIPAFTSASFVSSSEYILFSWITNTILKEQRRYTWKSASIPLWTKFTFCVYNETENKEWLTKKVLTSNAQELVMSWLWYDTLTYLTNKTPNQKIVNLLANKSIFNNTIKTLKWTELDSWIDVQWWNIIKVYWRIAVNNAWFHDWNWYYNSESTRQWHIMYKIWNSEWKEWWNIIEVKQNGRLYLTVADNDNNLENNLWSFKVVIDKPIVTNSVRDNNNLYFNIYKNINQYKITLWETTDWTDFTPIYTSNFLDATKIKVKWLTHVYEKKYTDLIWSKTIAFDGSYYYVIKNNELLKVWSGYNETLEWDITKYTLDKNLASILSIVAINGRLYVWYNDKWLSEYIWEIIITWSGTATVKNIKLTDSLLSVDLWDIKNRKLENNRYLLTSDDRYIYNISYLAWNEGEWNSLTKDKWYQVKIFDPLNEMALVKDVIINPLLNSAWNVTNKIGYYTEGAFVDKNYLYIIQKASSWDDANVVIFDKITFEYQDKVLIKQYATACSTASNETGVYSCAKNGVYDLLNNRLITLSWNVWKLHFYNIDTDNLVHFKVPDNIDLDRIAQQKKFLVKYDYTYNKLLVPETYISLKNWEKISNDTKYVDKWYQLKNSKITAVVWDVIRETATDKLYKEFSWLVKLTRNDWNSSSIRWNDIWMNYSYMKINWVIQKWRWDYATVSKIEDNGFIVKGERDAKSIVPSVRYELNADEEFMKITLLFRNDWSVELSNNDFEYSVNLWWNFDFIDERWASKSWIGEGSTKYIVADHSESDDSLVFAIKNSANQRLGISNGALNDIKLLVKNIVLQPWEERWFEFFVWSKKDSESNADYFNNKIMNNVDLTLNYANTDADNINRKLLSTNISKSDRVIVSPTMGWTPDYTYESNTVDIVSAFTETFNADRVDGSWIPLANNGWWSDNFVRNASNNTLDTTIQNAAWNGKIATLELVKYIPDTTQISFKASWKTDGGADTFVFFLDDNEVIKRTWTFNETFTYTVPKWLHIFTWKYWKDQWTWTQSDIIAIDDVNIWKVLDVFWDNCAYAWAALFYTTSYYNNFNKIQTSNWQNFTYRNSICEDEAENHTTVRPWPAICNEEDAWAWTHNGVTSRTTLSDTNGWVWDPSRTRAYWWYVAKYGTWQVSAANMFVDNGYTADNMYFDITHPSWKWEMKIYFDWLFWPTTTDDRLNIYYKSALLGSGWYNLTSWYLNQQWKTKILNNEFTWNESITANFVYWETDGWDDGATYIDNVIMKIKDPKSGCQLAPKAYNDKLWTHFIIPWYNMQTSNDRTKDVRWVVHVLAIEADTFVDIQKINPTTWVAVGDKVSLYNERVWQKLSFNVEKDYNYEITTNKNVSVLMDNFYPDLTRTGDTTMDDTPTYDMQNGDNFVIMIPWNKYKKWNLYLSNYSNADATVTIRDLTNNKTNYDIVLKSEPVDTGDLPIIDSTISWTKTIGAWANHIVFITWTNTVKSIWRNDKWQLWNDTLIDSTNIVDVSLYNVTSPNKIVSVSAWLDHNILLDDRWNVYWFWNNTSGELWNSSTNTKIPQKSIKWSLSSKQFTDISAWWNYSLFLDTEWVVHSVWKNDKWQLCNWNTTDNSTPAVIASGDIWSKKIRRIYTSMSWTNFLVDEDNNVYGCWYNGWNLWIWNGTNQTTPKLISNSWLWDLNKGIKFIDPESWIIDNDWKLYRVNGWTNLFQLITGESFWTLKVKQIANKWNLVLLDDWKIYKKSWGSYSLDATAPSATSWIVSNVWWSATWDLLVTWPVTVWKNATVSLWFFTTPTNFPALTDMGFTYDWKEVSWWFYHHWMAIKEVPTWLQRWISHNQETNTPWTTRSYSAYLSNTSTPWVLTWLKPNTQYQLSYSTYYGGWTMEVSNVRSTSPIMSIWLYNNFFIKWSEVYVQWPNGYWELWLWHKNIQSTIIKNVNISNLLSPVNPAWWSGNWSVDETTKPYRSIKWIWEGQILKITSTQPITIYYGLWNKPAINELISPNSQTFYYPILWNVSNITDYNTQMYTYYDLNLAKIQNYEWYTIRSWTINIWDDINVWISNPAHIWTWNKWISTWPVWMAVWNKSSSYDYLYPIKSSKKLYGIWNLYLFNNVNANKLVIIADDNGWNPVTLNIKENNGTATTKTLQPYERYEHTINPNKYYSVETTDTTKSIYVYSQKWDNVRNTFTTVFKSRTDKQLPNKIIKNNIGDKYLKYDLKGDFDFIIDEPKLTWSVSINNSMYNAATSAEVWSLTNVPVNKDETLIVNGIWANWDATPTDLIVDTLANWKYINGQNYKTQHFNNLDSWLYYKSTLDTALKYVWGWFKNTWNDDIFKLWVKDTNANDNWPDAIYKVYDKNTYFPEISWEPLYNYIKPTWNILNIDIVKDNYFWKRNLSQKKFDLSFINGKISVTTTANSTEFTDTYYVPIIRNVNATTLDYVELNKVTNLKFTRTWSDYWVICATVEDNNYTLKNICYTNILWQWMLKTDLLNIWRIKSLNWSLTNHVRNIYSDYTEIFQDWTKPMKLLWIEFTWIKKENFDTTFSNVAVENYTDIAPELVYKPNINIFSTDTPLSHSLKVWLLKIQRWSYVLKPQTTTLNITSWMNTEDTTKRKTFTHDWLEYKAVYITDNDLLNNDMNESTYNGNMLYPLEEKKDYMLFFRARWFWLKQIQIVNENDTYTYVDSLFSPRQYTWNMIESGAYDIWDFYWLSFKTNWWDNENVKVKFINHDWDVWLTDIRLLRLDDSDFANNEAVKQWDGSFVNTPLPNTWKLPTYLSKNKKGNVIWDITYKMFTYYKDTTTDWIWTINTTAELETQLTTLKNAYNNKTDVDLFKIFSYSNDQSILNMVNGNKYDRRSIDVVTTNIYSPKAQNLKVRIWMVWAIKLNGSYIFKNLNTEKTWCITWSWNYTNYASNDIKSSNCLIDINLIQWKNIIEFLSVVKNDSNSIKWIYKDTSFNIPNEWTASTTYELLTYWVSPWMPISPNSLIPNNTTLTNAVSIEWQSANVWIIWQEIELLSVQNIDRDYALKEIPIIQNTDTNRNKDTKDVTRIIEFWKPMLWTTTWWTNVDDYLKSNVTLPTWTVNVDFIKNTNIGANKNDVLELFVKFPVIPKQFNIYIENTAIQNQNIFWWENYMFNSEIDWKTIIKAWEINDLIVNKWYKIYIPIKWTIFEWQNINKIRLSAFAWEFQLSEVTLLKDKLLNQWNNVRVSFDLNVLPETQKRDIIFWLTNNSTLLANQWYEIKFSKNGATTEILKNGTVIWTASNDKSFIKDWVDTYSLMFVKNKNKLFLSAKYDYLDPADNIYKVIVDNIIEVTDNTPLNLKNSQLVFKNNKNKYKVSNVKIEDGEDNEKVNFLKFSAVNQTYSNWTVTVYNNKWQKDTTTLQLYDNLEDVYVALNNLLSYNSTITDVVVKPNQVDGLYNTYNIKELSLIKESETPNIISWNPTMDVMWITKIKKWSDVLQTFKNTKEFIMWFTVFVSKVTNQIQPEWLTLRFYEADSNGNPKTDGSWNKIVLAEKNVNTDAVWVNPTITPLKIVFPQIAVVDWQDYVFELSTNNKDWLYIYWTNQNKLTDWYSYTNKEEHSFVEAFEFNELWNRTFASRWWIWYLGSTLNWPDMPTRQVVSGDNMKIIAKKDNLSTITVSESSNIKLNYQATFIMKWKFTPSNWINSPLIAEKQYSWWWVKNIFWFYIDKTDTSKMQYGIHSLNGNQLAWWKTNFDVTWSDITIAMTIDTAKGEMKIYKDNVLMDTKTLDPSVIWTPFINIDKFWTTSMKFFWQHNGWTWNQELDYFRVYDKVLSQPELVNESRSINRYKTKLPYDIAFFMISKSSEIESLEERTYDLWEKIVYEVSGDLILNWYDTWDWIKRLILKWNSTFRVKWNIYINAEEVLVINDNTKEGDEALSYIWFVTDQNITIWKDVRFMQGWYYAKESIKTELSNKQLKVNWLLAWNEIDLQNRTYLQRWKICSADESENCSVILEYDKRIYKRMPPLFYENDDKSWIKITEE